MPPEVDGSWLRELLLGMQQDIAHVRDKVDGFDERITRLEAFHDQQARRRWNAPHWMMVGVAGLSMVWSIIWTLH